MGNKCPNCGGSLHIESDEDGSSYYCCSYCEEVFEIGKEREGIGFNPESYYLESEKEAYGNIGR